MTASIFTVIMMAMYTRLLKPPEMTFFLFGPRGTGKSTWLKKHFSEALWFDLLDGKLFLELLADPSRFRSAVLASPPNRWVVVDEVQKVPSLLSEVHFLIESGGYRFALSGSSARKFKKEGADLLAGRAIVKNMFPLTYEETGGTPPLTDVLSYGMLPQVLNSPAEYKADILNAYCATYLKEEIQQEALVRRLDSFSRFLECAAIANGQVTNVAGIARDAMVARPTVQGYFDILVDTLVGAWLPAWRSKAKMKEVGHPKFYWFDPAVARFLAGFGREPLDQVQKGVAFECYLLHELKAYLSYMNVDGKLYYWRTPSGSEVDFIWVRGNRTVAVEAKASSKWRDNFLSGVDSLSGSIQLESSHVVYLGDRKLKVGSHLCWPAEEFLKALYQGKIF